MNHLRAFREGATEAGRDPDTVEVTVYACPPDKQLVQRYADAGISRVVFGTPPADREAMLPLLDLLATLA